MDVGRRRALGLCALSLWALGFRTKQLVLGSWSSCRRAGLCARARSVRRRRRIQCRNRHWISAGRMVPARTARSLRPWYHTSPRYVQNVNVTNTRVSVVQVTNVYNNYTVNKVTNVTYVNRRVNNSVTVVNHDTFVNARPVNRNIQRVDARQLANARVTPAVVRNVQPNRQSFQGVAHPVQYRPPQQAISRPVVATRQPVVFNRPANRPNAGPGGAGRPTPPL